MVMEAFNIKVVLLGIGLRLRLSSNVLLLAGEVAIGSGIKTGISEVGETFATARKVIAIQSRKFYSNFYHTTHPTTWVPAGAWAKSKVSQSLWRISSPKSENMHRQLRNKSPAAKDGSRMAS